MFYLQENDGTLEEAFIQSWSSPTGLKQMAKKGGLYTQSDE